MKAEAGFDLMEIYIRRMQNTVVKYIATRSILDLCEVSKRKQGAHVGMRWWKQVAIDLEGEMEMAAAEVEVDKDGLEQ